MDDAGSEEDTVMQLQKRFPDVSPKRVLQALKASGGHAGRAATSLRNTVGITGNVLANDPADSGGGPPAPSLCGEPHSKSADAMEHGELEAPTDKNPSETAQERHELDSDQAVVLRETIRRLEVDLSSAQADWRKHITKEVTQEIRLSVTEAAFEEITKDIRTSVEAEYASLTARLEQERHDLAEATASEITALREELELTKADCRAARSNAVEQEIRDLEATASEITALREELELSKANCRAARASAVEQEKRDLEATASEITALREELELTKANCRAARATAVEQEKRDLGLVEATASEITALREELELTKADCRAAQANAAEQERLGPAESTASEITALREELEVTKAECRAAQAIAAQATDELETISVLNFQDTEDLEVLRCELGRSVLACAEAQEGGNALREESSVLREELQTLRSSSETEIARLRRALEETQQLALKLEAQLKSNHGERVCEGGSPAGAKLADATEKSEKLRCDLAALLSRSEDAQKASQRVVLPDAAWRNGGASKGTALLRGNLTLR